MPAARDDFEALKIDIDRGRGSDFYGSTSFVGRTVAVDSYPTTAGAFYAVTPQRLAGDEEEGEAVEYDAEDYGPLYAYNTGAKIPPEGTAVLVSSVSNRMVFTYG